MPSEYAPVDRFKRRRFRSDDDDDDDLPRRRKKKPPSGSSALALLAGAGFVMLIFAFCGAGGYFLVSGDLFSGTSSSEVTITQASRTTSRRGGTETIVVQYKMGSGVKRDSRYMLMAKSGAVTSPMKVPTYGIANSSGSLSWATMELSNIPGPVEVWFETIPTTRNGQPVRVSNTFKIP